MPYGIPAFTANSNEKSRFRLPCIPRSHDNAGMSEKKPATDPQAAARHYAAARRAMGAGAFGRLAEMAAPALIPDVLQNDPVWLPLRREMPWLPDLARLEAMAADAVGIAPAPPLDAEGLQEAARDPMRLDLYLQPHLRLLRSGWDIPAIWQALADGQMPQQVPPAESFTAIYNDDGNAAVWSITEPAHAVLEALGSAPDFAAAARAALRIDSGFALDRFLALLVQQRLLLKKEIYVNLCADSAP
jgi:hypothetical protein